MPRLCEGEAQTSFGPKARSLAANAAIVVYWMPGPLPSPAPCAGLAMPVAAVQPPRDRMAFAMRGRTARFGGARLSLASRLARTYLCRQRCQAGRRSRPGGTSPAPARPGIRWNVACHAGYCYRWDGMGLLSLVPRRYALHAPQP